MLDFSDWERERRNQIAYEDFLLDVKYGVTRKKPFVEPLGSVPFPPDLTIILRILSNEDDEFIRAHSGPIRFFRSDRRRIFKKMIPRVKLYFETLQNTRRIHMQRRGKIEAESMVGDTFVFTRALLELRAALLVHYVSVSGAAAIVRLACAEIEACLSIASTLPLEQTSQT